MKKILYLLTCLLVTFPAYSQQASDNASIQVVDELNQSAYTSRLTDPEQTVTYGRKALALAQKLNYKNGIGEAYRVIGIGNAYLGNEQAISAYLTALTYFKESKNLAGETKVYNNIGNLYMDVDYDRGLKYFQKALSLAQKQKIQDLIAGLHLNIGTIHYRKQNYNQALNNYQKSYDIFKKINNQVGLTQAIQNQGIIYYNLHQFEKAEKLLLEARKRALENDLNNTIASINLTLSNLYLATNRLNEVETVLKEGIAYAQMAKNQKTEVKYLYASYKLEHSRKNFEKALHYLQEVYVQDSIAYARNVSAKIDLLQEQYRQREKERENELIIERQRNNNLLVWASCIVSALLLLVIGLLVRSNKRKVKTNKQLTVLNLEISQQKEELDWINNRLETLIDEKTADLRNKNQKLSDYSWHLSHQIRGPIATMKGLMILEKGKMIDDKDFIKEMSVCLEEIDKKIHNINDSLHNPRQQGYASDADK